MPCKLTSACSFTAARPLREGGAYCSHHLWQGWAPPDDCAGVAGACTAALGADADDSVAAALDLEYCDACKASWRAVGGWCDSNDRDAWFAARGLYVRVRCAAMKPCGARCHVTSLQPHAGAEPLRCGADRCAAHGGVVSGAPAISLTDVARGQLSAAAVSDQREQRTGRLPNYGVFAHMFDCETFRDGAE